MVALGKQVSLGAMLLLAGMGAHEHASRRSVAPRGAGSREEASEQRAAWLVASTHRHAGSRPEVSLELPADGISSDLFTIREARGGRLAARRIGLGASRGRKEGDAIVYGEGTSDTDARVFPTAHGVEDLWVARGPGSEPGYDLELPRGWCAVQVALPGLVEIRDTSGNARLRVWMKRAWDAAGREVPVEPKVVGCSRVRAAFEERHVTRWPLQIDPEWTAAVKMATPRYQHTATRLSDGRILIAGGDFARVGPAEAYDPRTGTFTSVGPMSGSRANHTATLLPDGRVLVTGGDEEPEYHRDPRKPKATAEVFDPKLNTFSPAGDLLGARSHHTATLLPGGKVLLAGGIDANGDARADAEVYDGNSLSTSSAPIALPLRRTNHSAVLLADGSVLLVGGDGVGPELDQVGADLSHATPSIAQMSEPRAGQGTVLLPSGKVLIAGYASSDLFDPVTRTITKLDGGSPSAGITVALPSGRVLLAGGTGGNGFGPTYSTAFLFDARGGEERSFLPVAPLAASRELATVTWLSSGLALVAGGFDRNTNETLDTVELYDPGEGQVESTGSMLETRHHATATLLDSGEVVVIGGRPAPGDGGAEIYDPSTRVFRAPRSMVIPRAEHTTTKLPSGLLVVAGGVATGELTPMPDTEIFDPATGWFRPGEPMTGARAGHGAALLSTGEVLMIGGNVGDHHELRRVDGTFFDLGPELTRYWPTATPLDGGRALIAGGRLETVHTPTNLMAIFENGQFTAVPQPSPPTQGRAQHTASRLFDGTVLLAGGSQGEHMNEVPTASFEVIDAQGKLIRSGSLTTPRLTHSATPLVGEKRVLIAAGSGQTTAEVLDTVTGDSTLVQGELPEIMDTHAAARLLDGRVVILGGLHPDGSAVAGAVVYDPSAPAGSQLTFENTHVRTRHTATVLSSGKLLLVGGADRGDGGDFAHLSAVTSASLFDPSPVARTFSDAGTMSEARLDHTATRLDGDRVLVTGGQTSSVKIALDSIDLWSAEKGFEPWGHLTTARANHAAIRLRNGKVLVTGGWSLGASLASAEVLDADSHSVRAAAAMKHARHGHALALLPSGRVLVAGGLDDAGDPVATAEIFDPSTGIFSEITTGTSPIWTDAHASVLPSGEVLIVGLQIAYRFDESTGELLLAGAPPDNAFGAGVLPGGRLTVCGLDFCDTATETGQSTGRVRSGAQRDGHTLSLLLTGELFGAGASPAFARQTHSYRSFPREAMRPTIADTPKLVAGTPAQVAGTRFMHLTGPGGDTLGAFPHILPQVVFVPEASGAPLTAPVLTWSDTAIRFTAPRTPYTGGGWLHVLVDGVPSIGVWTTLDPVAAGGACSLDGECSTGHCAEGVCCDQACEEGCRSCVASKTGDVDGVCKPIPEDEAPRFGCEPTASVCSPSGLCDGAGECAFPPAGTTCDDPPGGTCSRGDCVAKCTSNLDCAAGYLCWIDGRCVPPEDPGDDGGCACHVGSPGEAPRFTSVLLSAIAAGLLALRRGARSRPCPRRLAAGKLRDGVRRPQERLRLPAHLRAAPGAAPRPAERFARPAR